MYGWENALYANGLMSPWANAWGAQPQTIADTVVREQVAPALGLDTPGETPGFSVGGDPNAATQTSQATKDRVRGSLTGSLTGNLATAGLKTGVGMALGMPTGMVGPAVVGSLASPGAVGNVLGGAVNAALGTKPQGFLSKTVANFGVPALAGMAFGPVGGLAGGLMGGVVADAIGDGLNVRSREDVRDDYEGQAGYFGGRMGYADRVGLEQKAAAMRDALPSSAAAIHAMDQAIAATRALEQQRGITPSYGMEPGGFSAGKTYGGWASPGGPSVNGARAVDRSYGPSMGGFAGLGIGNPSSYGGRTSSSSGSGSGGSGGGRSSGGGGYGGHAGGKDGSSTGFGR